MNDKATAAKGSEDPILQWVTFKLDNETYGINVMRVQEVLRYTEIAPVPGAPSYCLLYTSPSPRDATLSRMPSSA